MGIKRGVSLYSYQQAEFFGQMTWKDQLREVATNLNGADGIEIVCEATIRQYPMPPESFYYEWNNEMARWGLKAVTMDTYLDTLQFRDHVMNYEETAEHIKYDLRIAKKMGFQNIRLVHNVPHEAIEMALPLAEELDVRMTNEIHAPMSIKPKHRADMPMMGSMSTRVAQDVAFIQRTGTKHYGLQPDFGIFTSKPCRVSNLYFMRDFLPADTAEKIHDEIMQIWNEEGGEAAVEAFVKRCPDVGRSMFGTAENVARMLFLPEPSASPEDLYSIAPYIFCCHGKCIEMVEIPGEPGHYEESSIDYKGGIEVLKGLGYEGYIDTEYEGQRNLQDIGPEYLADEVEQVRRHHEMMKRLIEG